MRERNESVYNGAMYVARQAGWLSFLFEGRVLPHIWGRVIVTTALSVGVTAIAELTPAFKHHHLTLVPFTLIGVPLGIFLGFRNNTSYDRFWEGRRLWGSLVNTSRSLGRQILTLVEASALYNADEPEVGVTSSNPEIATFQREMVYRLIAFVHALRLHLRGQPFDELSKYLSEAELKALAKERNVPTAIVHAMGHEFQRAWHRGWIHPQHLPVMEASLAQITDIQGACERIKSTPIPYSYTVLMHRIVGAYCLLLPFGAVDQTKLFPPLVVLFMSYAFFGLDAIGSEVEDPFGLDANDLPLSALSTTIEINLRQRLGETELPAAPTPVDRVLR